MLGQRRAQRLAGPMASGLDRSLRDTEQLARFGAGQAVQHGRLQRGAQLRGQLRERLPEPTVLEPEENLILR